MEAGETLEPKTTSTVRDIFFSVITQSAVCVRRKIQFCDIEVATL
jgi:hypothetical protein